MNYNDSTEAPKQLGPTRSCSCGYALTQYYVIICEDGYEVVTKRDAATCESNVYATVLAVDTPDVRRMVKGLVPKHTVYVNEGGIWVAYSPASSHRGQVSH